MSAGDYHRALHREQNDAVAKIHRRTAATSGQANAPMTDAVREVTRQAYIKVWQYAQEALEGLALSFMFADLMMLTVTAIAVYALRGLGGPLLGNPQIGWGGIQVPLFPGYGMKEGVYRTAKILFLAAVTGIIYGVITIAIYFATHPLSLVQHLGCQRMPGVMNSLGVPCQSLLTPSSS